MSWVRLDDGFTSNPKIVELSDAEFRTWLRILCFCARSKDPTVDDKVRREVPGLSPKRIQRFWELGLLDDSGGVHEVHDWPTYQPKDSTNVERQARWRARKKGVTSNGDSPVTDSLRPRAQARSSRPVLEKNRGLSEARPEGQGFGFTIDKDLLRDIPR